MPAWNSFSGKSGSEQNGAMEVEVWATAEASNEAAGMVTRWYAWPLMILRNLQGAAIVIALFIGGCVVFVESVFTSKPDISKAAIGLAMITAPIALFWWVRRSEAKKTRKALEAVNPLRLTFTLDGIHTLEKSGSSNFEPWSHYGSFREGKNVILLRSKESRSYRAIPKNTVPPSDVEKIRTAVRGHLPEIR